MGRVAVYAGDPACINQSIALLRPDSTQVIPKFLALTLGSAAYQARMRYEAGGTTIKHIYISRLSKMKVFFPQLGEQAAILETLEDRLHRLSAASRNATAQISLLAEYRDSLTAEVVTGKLDTR